MLSYGTTVPPSGYLNVTGGTLRLKNGATWDATEVPTVSGEGTGSYYVKLNNLNMVNGTVNILDTTNGILVDRIEANNATFNGGKLEVDEYMNISGLLTVNTFISGRPESRINFADGSSLKTTLNGSTIISGYDVTGTTKLLLETTDIGKTFAVEGYGQNTLIFNNDLYNITSTPIDSHTKKWTVSAKSGEEILADTPATLQEANTISALVATSGKGTEQGNAIAHQISTLMQTGHKETAVELAEEVAPTTSQTVMGVAHSINNMLNNVASSRMAVVGRSSGDAFVGGAMWVQGLMNHTKQDEASNTAGFSADTAGVSFGIDGKVNEDLMIGIGYGYTNTDADSGNRDIDVDGHNFFAYAEYQPNNWYINGMFSYGLNKYEEKKIAGLNAKYDVNTYAANVMTGYDFDNGITPEVGLRYLLANQEAYTDGVQRISSDKADVLTGVVGIKYEAEMQAKDWAFKPNLRLAATYDMLSDNSKANVSVIGGGNYQITGKRLERFGVETGIGIETTYKDWDLSVDYNGGFRKDFQSHTGMVKAKYNF